MHTATSTSASTGGHTQHHHLLFRDLGDLKDKMGGLIGHTLVSIPLVYTQLVEIVTHLYFLCTLFGSQYLQPTHYLQHEDGTLTIVPLGTLNAVNMVGYDDTITDFYVPFFMCLKFIFFFGWLAVAQSLTNPFGEDDEDFDMDYILNRNVQISYLMVEGDGPGGRELEDPYYGKLPTSLPHTVESQKALKTAPNMPTDRLIENMTEDEMALADEDKDEGHCNILSIKETDEENPSLCDTTTLQREMSIRGSVRVLTKLISSNNLGTSQSRGH